MQQHDAGVFWSDEGFPDGRHVNFSVSGQLKKRGACSKLDLVFDDILYGI